jgi:uncharacterized protein (UPF0276 family)
MAPIGISAGTNPPHLAFDHVDFVEIKTSAVEEAVLIRTYTDKPVYMHVQFSPEGRYLLPTAMDFQAYAADFAKLARAVEPAQVSLHFGLSASSISSSGSTHYAVTDGVPLSKTSMVETLEKNLRVVRSCFPQSLILLENQEFIPECLCGGAYRYIQEAGFFTVQVTRWLDMGLLDGIVFDVAHALITAGNHPHYNGLAKAGVGRGDYRGNCRGRSCTYDDPLQTNRAYIEELGRLPADGLLGYYDLYIKQMPLHLIREIHISGIGRNTQGVYIDTHREIGELELTALDYVLDTPLGMQADAVPITLEYTRSEQNIIPQLNMLKQHAG